MDPEFGRILSQIPEVMDAYLVSGDYDYYIRIAVKDTRDYERLLREKLYKIPGIRQLSRKTSHPLWFHPP